MFLYALIIYLLIIAVIESGLVNLIHIIPPHLFMISAARLNMPTGATGIGSFKQLFSVLRMTSHLKNIALFILVY